MPLLKTNEKSDYELLNTSKYFDKKWYLNRYPDVAKAGKDPIEHYLKYGWKEGRNPGLKFNSNAYYQLNKDVNRNENPLLHYLKYGQYERRKIKPVVSFFERLFVKKTAMQLSDYDLIKKSKYFNAKWYLKTYADVAKAGKDPIEHYLKYGWKEGRNPSNKFSTNSYLSLYHDVKKAGVNPLVHYLKRGRAEGRLNVLPLEQKDIDKYRKKYLRYPHDDFKKVFLLSHELTYTGAPLSLLQAAKCYQSLGYKVTLLSYKDGELKKEFKQNNIKVYIYNQKDNKKIVKIALKSDFVIVNTLVPYQMFEVLAKIMPTMWWVRESAALPEANEDMKSVLKNASNVYAMSPYSRDEFLKYNSKTAILKHGIEDLYENVPIDSKNIVFALIGTIGERKGQDIFIEAVKKLPKELREKAKFYIVGHPVQKKFYEEVKKQAQGIDEIVFKEPISDFKEMIKFYENISCVVVPSRDEPTSRVVIEAYMMGRPAVVSDHVGAKYLIDNEKNGFIFPSGNADELAKKLENFIKNFDQLYEKMGKAAREAYLKNNTISLLMKNLELAAQNLKKTTLPTPQKTKSKSDYEIIAQSKYFDKDYYLKTYPEVAKAKIDPIKHYLEIGWKEFKNPSEKFNTKNYLYTYQDVLRANRNPLLHWEKNGKHELREAELKCIKNGKYYENLPFWKYKEELELWYKSRAKKEIDLNNPQTYNEKLQWLKLYDARPEKTMLADKYEVREWIKKKIGEEYLIPLIGVYEKFDDIDIEKLPKKFVMKCTHGSGWNIIVKDKEEFNIAEAREKMERWLNSNFAYSCGFELQYKNMKPRIIIEEYMDDGSGDLRDYKFTCFNGKVDFIWVDSDRHTKHRRTLYSTKWEKLPYKMGTQYEADEPVEKPKELSKMLSFAARLSKGFAYVRVDFYVINNKVYFGELTFTSTSGIDVAEPKSFERHLFQALKLPRKAYDLSRQQYCRVSEAYPQPHIDVTAIQNQPEQKSKSDLTLSIVIPIYNALSDVKKCLFSLNRAHLLPSTEIFLIDDCSDTQTQNYLLSFVNKFKKFQYVRNPVNSGFIISSNKGIDLAHNDIVVILNSDTKVPRGFDALISACFIAHPRVAVASPLSTHSGLFSIPERPHSKLDSIQKLLNDNVKPTYPLITPEGFCLCLNKRIINKIGKLDEIYGFGYSEEDDLILRALSKGYKTVLIDNLIVYHKSHASFTSERRLKILEKNRRIFRQRWGNLQAETRQAMNMMNIVKTINDNVNRLIDNKENHVRFKSKKSR